MFHVKHEGWPDIAAALGLSFSEATLEQLERYEALLRTHAVPLGMIGPAEVDRLRGRHIADALRAAPLLPPRSEVVDLGAGAGIPGIPLAIVRLDVSMTLVEARRKRAAFLELVVDTVDVPNARVHAGRVEGLGQTFTACVARAFAPLAATWEAADRLLLPDGVLLYWAGEGFDPEALHLPGTRVRIVSTSALAEAGPIVIMTRQ